jgi:hypothetical protein
MHHIKVFYIFISITSLDIALFKIVENLKLQ